MKITFTIPEEFYGQFEREFCDCDDEIQKTKTQIDGRTSYVYEKSLYDADIHKTNIIGQLENIVISCTHEIEFDVIVKNRGLLKGMTSVCVFRIDDDNPKTYICAALERAFPTIENFTDNFSTQIAFRRNEHFDEALKWLEVTEKPDLEDVAWIQENLSFGGEQFLNEAAIERAVAASGVNSTTAFVMRTALSGVIDIVQRLFDIRNPFLLGWLHDQNPDCGVFVEDDYGKKRFFGCGIDDLQTLIDEWWELDAEDRYAHYYGKTE